MTRRMAREVAFHLVFEMEFHPGSREEVLEYRLSEPGFSLLEDEVKCYSAYPDDNSLKYIRGVASGVLEHGPEIDGYIEKYAIGWNPGRISRVCVALLRVCIFEILYVEDVPPRSAINEAVEFAKLYDGEDIPGFLNGLLGSFMAGEGIKD